MFTPFVLKIFASKIRRATLCISWAGFGAKCCFRKDAIRNDDSSSRREESNLLRETPNTLTHQNQQREQALECTEHVLLLGAVGIGVDHHTLEDCRMASEIINGIGQGVMVPSRPQS
jgi:hypothetical protein